jgi:hypothetical protein
MKPRQINQRPDISTAEIIRLYTSGQSTHAIGRSLGINQASVLQKLAFNGVRQGVQATEARTLMLCISAAPQQS